MGQLLLTTHRLILESPSIKMPMESERLAEEHQRKELTAHSYSLVTAVLALVMIIVGSVYWTEEDCKLGASSYLYYGGVFSLTINILGLSSSVAKYPALKVIQIMTISIHNQSSSGW